MTGLDRGALALIELALAEDIGSGDITTLATVPADRQATGRFLVKQPDEPWFQTEWTL